MAIQKRLASTIDLAEWAPDSKPKTTTVSLTNPVKFTVEQAKDPTILAHRLNALELGQAENTQVQRSHPEQGPVTFKNVVVGTGGSKVRLQHNRGYFVEFIVTKWAGNGVTAAPILVSDELDTTPESTVNMLVLRSEVAGTASIRVY